MLTFKTQFPINPNKTIDDLIEVGRIWLAGSPHSTLSEKMKLASEIGDEWQVSDGKESVVFARIDGSEKLCGVTFESSDKNSLKWHTEIVGAKKGSEFWVSVQLSVDSELPLERIYHGKPPHIIKLIIQKIGGGLDGEISVSDGPIYLRDDQLDFAADLITGDAGCVMPVVYVSVDNNGDPFVDPRQLARWLSGMAHVVVEPTRKFSYELMHLVDSENAYGGAVAIYWPDGIGKWTFIPEAKDSDPKEMQAKITRKVRMSLLSQRTRRDCTWSYLQEIKARRRIQEIRESGTNQIDELIEMFDLELKSKNDEIQRLEAEISRIKYGSQFDRGDGGEGRKGLSLQSNERDLYQGERLAVVMDALRREQDACDDYSRRAAIVADFISSNIQEGQRSEILDELKELLRDYSSMTSGVRNSLEHLGFDISDEGKHYKLIFRGEERYPFILSKTGSDWRSGLNSFSDVKKKLF
ncbi:hypothetical protein FCJ61_36980 [Burkholderia metallica]|uniref:hypothetical protein n=1 Tax=Burkholderia metallica TaxID=488729 RepID=UPI00157AA932|nr:hypothetical protein [Burkholderia metallica]NTZ88437.1 hypothetical protein [Burkholderia metallica]